MDNVTLPAPVAVDEVDVAPLNAEIGFLIRIAQLRVYNHFFEKTVAHGLKPGGYSVLWVIHRNPGIRQGLLAQRLLIKPAHMTKLVRRFEERGLIERRVPEDNRRALELFLTDKGERFLKEHEGFFFGFLGPLTASLSEAEHREFIRLLQKFTGMEPCGDER